MESPVIAADAGVSPPKPRPLHESAPVVVEVRGLRKSFRVPTHKVDTLKERATRPLARTRYWELEALRDVSFDVHKGEFLGIVGRNGSGKSTLLKILASIYRADAGRVRVAGRLAPFIELGVGLNPELSARENVALNGVLMGLSRREAQGRLDAVLDFAELREFIDLKIKNYSSGMMVRLAFAVMIQADADIMLIDEVLAVGDAAFGQKCMDVFYERRDAGKTIVLVTHDMSTVEAMCHRAIVISDGELQMIGEPDEAAMLYYRLNFAGPVDGYTGEPLADKPVVLEFNARLHGAQLLDEVGKPVDNLEQGAPIRLDVELEAMTDLDNPLFVVHMTNADGVVVHGFTRAIEQTVHRGQKIRLAGEIENLLVPGRYAMYLWIGQHRQAGDAAVQPMTLLRFVVFGTAPRHGVVALRTSVEAELEA
jgi:ABC-type polysaccharide/polyol phosphate transport system ATPase subunit